MWLQDPHIPNLLRWYENGQPTVYIASAAPAAPAPRRDYTKHIFVLLAIVAFIVVAIALLTGLDNLMK
jgi:hypothetical protein